MDNSSIPVILTILSSLVGMAFLWSKTVAVAKTNGLLIEQTKILAEKVATNARQTNVDMQAAAIEKDKLVTTMAADWMTLKNNSSDQKDRIIFLEKREDEREANDKIKEAERIVRETEFNSKIAGLNTTLEAAYTEIKSQGETLKEQGKSLEDQHELLVAANDLLDRSYKQISLQSDQIKTLVTQVAKLTGQPEAPPPEGDKDIQDKAQAASGEPEKPAAEAEPTP